MMLINRILVTRCGLFVRTGTCVTQKRYRGQKKKWATNYGPRSPTDLALGYFDAFYKPVYNKMWPSIRASLLSPQKYAALLNNFSPKSSEVKIDLICNGADDIIQTALTRMDTIPSISDENDSSLSIIDKQKVIEDRDPFLQAHSEKDSTNDPFKTLGNVSLNSFMPVTKIMSEKEELLKQEIQEGFYEEAGHQPEIVTEIPTLPAYLQVFAHGRGQVDRFEVPKKDGSNKLGYYLMDGASILPVIALGLAPGDHVLDLCAAPGGKTLTMLQTMLPDHVTCVDNSYSRIGRLKEVIRSYCPVSYLKEETVAIHHVDGVRFCDAMHQQRSYHKVLVDVPCNTDRHSLMEDDNNFFKPGRQKERLKMRDMQKTLLMGGIKMAKRGGSIVYSTCTLSMAQNEGVIQEAIQELHSTSDTRVAVVNTGYLEHLFSPLFNFFSSSLFGTLVIPNLTANFGPMYICKLIRIE